MNGYWKLGLKSADCGLITVKTSLASKLIMKLYKDDTDMHLSDNNTRYLPNKVQ